jgi:hypothetical protein
MLAAAAAAAEYDDDTPGANNKKGGPRQGSAMGANGSVPGGSIYKRSVDGLPGGGGGGGGGNRRSLDLPALSSSMPGWS